MARAYPPIWCKNRDCLDCDSRNDCVNRTLELLEPYRDTQTPIEKREEKREVTTLAVYFGFCPRLAKFFMEFPSFGMIPVVYSNFMNLHTRLPTTQSIHRILLDTLASCDSGNLTDEIFRYRGIFFGSIIGINSTELGTKDGRKTFSFTPCEVAKAQQKFAEFSEKLENGNLEFTPSPEEEKCKICFLRFQCQKIPIIRKNGV
jgi:hypothetical protein